MQVNLLALEDEPASTTIVGHHNHELFRKILNKIKSQQLL